MSSQVSLILLN